MRWRYNKTGICIVFTEKRMAMIDAGKADKMGSEGAGNFCFVARLYFLQYFLTHRNVHQD